MDESAAAQDSGLPVIIRHTKEANAKVEGQHRIDAGELYRRLAGGVIDDTEGFNIKFRNGRIFTITIRCTDNLADRTP